MAHDQHPAVIASRMSHRLAGDKSREAWLALYHDDAFIQGPVGVSPLDPAGKGHIGKAAVTAFYDALIANTDMNFRVSKSFPAGMSAPMSPTSILQRKAAASATSRARA